MKKRLIILFIFLFSFSVQAVEWQTADQITLAWDAVTANVDGTIIDAEKYSMSYNVYSAYMGDKANAVLLDTVTEAEKTIQFSSDGAWLFGVQVIKWFNDQPTIMVESEISWSDNIERCQDGKTFGVVYMKMPAFINELRK